MQQQPTSHADIDDHPPAPAEGRSRRRRSSTWIAAAITVVLVAITLVSLPGNRRALIDPAGREPVRGVNEVEVRDDLWEYFAYTPSVLEVEAGTEVTWVFTSDVEHNVVFTEGPDSPLLERGATWSRTFDTPGDYRYVCTLHEGMDGRVVVTAADAG